MADGSAKIGRPSDYDPSFCDRVIEMGRLGKSKAYMAAKLDVSRQTLENWAATHPEFFDAITRAVTLSQAWWEDAGQENLTDSKFNSNVWSRSMAARFPEDWRETTRQELSGALAVENRRTLDVRNLTPDQREQLRALIEAAQRPAIEGPVVDAEYEEVEEASE